MSSPIIQAMRNFDFCQKYQQERPSGASRCFRDRGPPVYAMDVGRWVGNPEGWYIGLVSGSHMLVVQIMAEDERPIAQPTTPVLDNVINLLKARNLRPSVRKCLHKKIIPWKDEEEDYKDEILMSKDKLLVLFPDCHVGIRDDGDMFSPKGVTQSYDHLLDTINAIREAAGSQAKIVQLGDFLEVWETEAKRDIYFENTGEKRIERIERPDGTIAIKEVDVTRLIERPQRAILAIREVRKQWKDTLLPTVGKIFDMMILGNHDVERKWTLDDQFYDLGELNFCDRIQTGRDGCVIVEHGHHLDSYNDTRPANNIAEVLRKVEGKKNTYEYGRNKKGRRWPTPEPKDEDDTKNWPPLIQDSGVLDKLGDLFIGESKREYGAQLFREAYNVNRFILKDSNFTKNYQVPVRLWIHAHTHLPSIHEYTLDIGSWNYIWRESRYPGDVHGPIEMDKKPSLLGNDNKVFKWSDLAL